MSGQSIGAPLAYFAFNELLAGPEAQQFYDYCGDNLDSFAWPPLSYLGLSPDKLLHDIEMAGNILTLPIRMSMVIFLSGRNLKWGTGRLDPEWKRVQRLVRGRSELELSGGPDVLHTSISPSSLRIRTLTRVWLLVTGIPDVKKGRVWAESGDGYMQVHTCCSYSEQYTNFHYRLSVGIRRAL